MMLCWLHWKDEDHKRCFLWQLGYSHYSEDKYGVINTYNG